MKTLLLMRHAKSSWKDDTLDDHDRPLNKRGKKDAPRMGQLLRDEVLVPDFVLASTARRARKTADHVALASGFRGEMRITSTLYEAGAEQIAAAISETPESFGLVLLIGHNPGLEELLEIWTHDYRPMPTAAIAKLEIDISTWQELSLTTSVKLIQIWQPRELA